MEDPLSTKPVVRFAPSPTGHLHLGTARTAVFNWLFARRYGGRIILRIEDTDVERSARDFERSIVEDLRWLGIDWEEGPDVGGPAGAYRQSERAEEYARLAAELEGRGRVYRCYCTPDELDEAREAARAAGRMPKYSRRCLNLSDAERQRLAAERPAALRFQVPPADITVRDMLRGDISFSHGVIGDFVILRSDGRPAYNFAAVVDDIAMEITHIIRGEDHLTNSARQNLLYDCLGAPVPNLLHLGMVLGPDQAKLSKRHGAKSIAEYRQEGLLSTALVNYLGLLGWSDPSTEEVFLPDELSQRFDWHRVSRNPVIFDEAKLMWLNGRHIRMRSPEELVELAKHHLAASRYFSKRPKTWWILFFEAVHDSLDKLSDATDYAKIFIEEPEPPEYASEVFKAPLAQRALREMLAHGEVSSPTSVDDWKAVLTQLKKEFKTQGASPRNVLPPLRLALTGKSAGPELGYCLALLGRERVIQRLKDALALARGEE